MQQLKNFADKLNERWGIKTIQIHTHKDEGYTPEDKPGEWKPNLHTHMIFDWTDDTGKSSKLKKQDLAEMQTVLAECLSMERAERITAHLPELEEDYREALEQYDTSKDNLDQAAQHLQELKNDIRNTELKKSVMKAVKAILGVIERTFHPRRKLREEVNSLKRENNTQKEQYSRDIKITNENYFRERRQKEIEVSELKDELKEIQKHFPTMENTGKNIKQLRKLGVPDEHISGLLLGWEQKYSGGLYDTEHRHTHQVENVSIRIAPSTKGGMFVWLNNKNVTEFFRELWQSLQQALRLNRRQNQENSREHGFHM